MGQFTHTQNASMSLTQCRWRTLTDLPQLLSGDEHLGQPLQLCSLLLHGVPDAVHLSANTEKAQTRGCFADKPKDITLVLLLIIIKKTTTITTNAVQQHTGKGRN